jgi:hypothetical protein
MDEQIIDIMEHQAQNWVSSGVSEEGVVKHQRNSKYHYSGFNVTASVEF